MHSSRSGGSGRAATRLEHASGLSVDVVVPVLNEAQRIGAALARLQEHAFLTTIVVDGGSSDGTCDQVEEWTSGAANRTLIRGPRGRASQMNLGASHSNADVILFLHCDCTLPRQALKLIRSSLDAVGSQAGAFVTRTVREGHPRRIQRLMWLADLRSRHTRYPYGDQALFVKRSVFDSVGGFPNDPILEDLSLSRKLAHRRRIVRVNAPVVVSSRRFVGSPVRTGAVMRLIPVLAWLGVPKERLSALYPLVR